MLLSITSVLAAALLAPVPASTTQADASAQDPPIPDCGKMQILPSGLKFCVLKEGGDAEFPKIGDLVRVGLGNVGDDGLQHRGSGERLACYLVRRSEERRGGNEWR